MELQTTTPAELAGAGVKSTTATQYWRLAWSDTPAAGQSARPPANPFKSFAEYGKPGWDGEGASPIGKRVAGRAQAIAERLNQLLGSPWVTPGSGGTVGLYWNTPLGTVQASIRADRRIQLFAKCKPDNERMEIVLSAEVGASKVAGHVMSHLSGDYEDELNTATAVSHSSVTSTPFVFVPL